MLIPVISRQSNFGNNHTTTGGMLVGFSAGIPHENHQDQSSRNFQLDRMKKEDKKDSRRVSFLNTPQKKKQARITIRMTAGVM